MEPYWAQWARKSQHSDADCERAAASIQAGWRLHYLAIDATLGGGLSLSQLRSLDRCIHRVPSGARPSIDWQHWWSLACSDPAAASKSAAWIDAVARAILAVGKLRFDAGRTAQKSAAKLPHRQSPRTLLNAHARHHRPIWEYSASDVCSHLLRQLAGAELSLSADELTSHLAAVLPAAEPVAWDILATRSRDHLTAWACGLANRIAAVDPRPMPVLSFSGQTDGHVTVVAVDETGRCHGESNLSLGDREACAAAIAQLVERVGARLAVIPLGDSARRLSGLLHSISAEGGEAVGLCWILGDATGARWWASSIHSVDSLHQWSIAGREALFLAKRFQRPLEALAEMPVQQWAPPELGRWLSSENWERIEQEVTDLVHRRGIHLDYAGPKALGRLCSVTPLRAQRAVAPEGGWPSIEAFRQSLSLDDKTWQQTKPFVRLHDDSSTSDVQSIPGVRRTHVPWCDLTEGLTRDGVVLRSATFGVFVDLGAEAEALLHVSQMSQRYLCDPLEMAATGDVLRVQIVSLTPDKQQVALGMPDLGAPSSAKRRRRGGRGKRSLRGQAGAGKGGRAAKSAGRSATSNATPQGRESKKTRSTDVSRPRPEPKPITKEMSEGKAPLRSFSDLVQFYDQKRSEEDSS